MSADKLSVLRARNAEWIQAHAYLDESPINDGESDASLSLADRIAPIVNELISLRATIAALTAERDALAANIDAVHRAIGEMTGHQELATIYAVQAVIDERDAARRRRCEAAYYCGWYAALDSAAVCVAGDWRLRDKSGAYHEINLECVSDTIMTLEPPPAPTEHDAMQNEFDGVKCQCDCGCTRDADRYVSGLKKCEICYKL